MKAGKEIYLVQTEKRSSHGVIKTLLIDEGTIEEITCKLQDNCNPRFFKIKEIKNDVVHAKDEVEDES